MQNMQPRFATPEDRFYQLVPSRGLARRMTPLHRQMMRDLNQAAATAAGTAPHDLPRMPVRDMRRRKGVWFTYGLPAVNHGFTMATNYPDVLVKGVAQEMGLNPRQVFKTGSSLCLN